MNVAKLVETEEQNSGGLIKSAYVVAMGFAVLSAATACVQISAPDEPIVIELNINITQEVVYRLNNEAKETIDSNQEIF